MVRVTVRQWRRPSRGKTGDREEGPPTSQECPDRLPYSIQVCSSPAPVEAGKCSEAALVAAGRYSRRERAAVDKSPRVAKWAVRIWMDKKCRGCRRCGVSVLRSQSNLGPCRQGGQRSESTRDPYLPSVSQFPNSFGPTIASRGPRHSRRADLCRTYYASAP